MTAPFSMSNDKTATNFPLRVAVIGCGAISRRFHIPILAGHPDVRLTAFVDPQRQATEELAKTYGVEHVATDIGGVPDGTFNAAVIATPASLHSGMCLTLIERDAHVLVEKPMALSVLDARAMVAAAERAGRVLSVALFRRLFPAIGLLRSVVQERPFGRLCAFDVEEGHLFDWPSATLSIMRKELAGGGVLIDTGSHPLDQLLWVLDQPCEIVRYADDSHGGVEANCEVLLRTGEAAEAVEGRITLSRTRRLSNRFRFEFETAIAELSLDETAALAIESKALPRFEAEGSMPWRYRLEAQGKTRDQGPRSLFRAVVDDWVGAIRKQGQPVLSAASALPVVQLINNCYSVRQPLPEPGTELGARTPTITSHSRPKRVLVTGAAGFIGCRVAEVLSLREGLAVRALVHRPGGASRVARLPVELVQGDLRSDADVQRAVEGCDAVIHCAYGTEWGNRAALFDVTVGGTRRLLEAAHRFGVKQCVHLSTIMVYGVGATGAIHESVPPNPDPADAYAVSKADAEKVVADLARSGLPTLVLRLANVYGPFSGPFTIRAIRQLSADEPVLVDGGGHSSNTVFVDNVVEAIALALRQSGDHWAGATLNICDDDGFSWREFFGRYGAAMAKAARSISATEVEALRDRLSKQRKPRSIFGAVADIARSEELKAFGMRVLRTDPIGRVPRIFFEKFPSLRKKLVKRMTSGADVYVEGPQATPLSVELLDLYNWRGQIRADKAREVLGAFSIVPRDLAFARTIDWAKYSRLF